MVSITDSIESERFDLRPLTLDEASLFADLAADTEVVKTLIGDWSTAAKRLENARAWIGEDTSYVIWGVYDRAGAFGSSDEFIGFCGVEAPLEDIGQGPSVYYAYSRRVWGQGVASEVVSTVINYLFDTLGVDAVEALVYPQLNPASSRLLEKQGMKLAGRYALANYVGDECLPTMLYEVWRAQVAVPAEARQCMTEAAIKIGQFIAEGISSFPEMKTALTVSAHENGLVEAIGPKAVERLIETSLHTGMAENGWLYYRLVPSDRQ